MSIEGSIVKGEYTPFWGSLEWEIKIDFDFENLNNFEITFRNKNQQENTFEVNELCSVAQLFMRTLDLDEKFGEKLAVTRLSNFIAEYLGKYLAPVYPDDVTACLQDKKDRVQVKVKKMTTTDFYEALEFDEKDLAINFNQYYDDVKAETFSNEEEAIDSSKFVEHFKILNGNYQVSFKSTYMISGEENVFENKEFFIETDSPNNFLCKNKILNDNDKDIEELVCIATIPYGIKINDVRGKILAPDNSELGIFQPTEIKSINSSSIQVIWKLDSLKSIHSVEFSHTVSKRIINIAEITINNIKEYIVYFKDIQHMDDESFQLVFPPLIDLTKDEPVNQLVSIFPSEISFKEDSDFKNYIESQSLSETFREIKWTRGFTEMNFEISQENEVIFVSKSDILHEIEQQKEAGVEEPLIMGKVEEEVEPELDLQDELVAVEEVEETENHIETDIKSASEELEEVLSSSDPVLLYNSKGILDHISDLEDLSLFLRLRVPEGERFIVILMNPFEMVAAHIEGGNLPNQPFRKFKLPLMKIKGTWVLKVQFLENQIGSTTQYSLKIN